MKRKRVLALNILAVCLFAALLLLSVGDEGAVESDKEGKDREAVMNTKLIEEQKKVETLIQKKSKGSTLDSPYVQLNPYGTSPLAAIAVFGTDEPAQITITVKGKKGGQSISQTFKGFSREHEIPILGLYADYNNQIEVKAVSESGGVSVKNMEIQTDKLPDKLPSVTIKTKNQDLLKSAENDLTFAISSTKYSYGFDGEGEIRWYSTRYNSHVLQELSNGHILFLSKDSNDGDTYNELLEMDYTGKLYHVYSMGKELSIQESEGVESTVIHHDAIELPSGNLLLTINDGSGYVEDTMIEIDRHSGKTVKTIDLKELLPASFYTNYASTKRDDGKIDWFHQNAVVYDESDKSLIVSGRNQDTIMKIDYESGQIKWILADGEGWPSEYRDLLLTSEEADFKYPGGQHAPAILPDLDGNEDTIDLLVYDNNVAVSRGDEDLSKTYSEAVHYRINEKEKKIETVWSYGKSRGENYFTNIIGSARFLNESGNVLISFGFLKGGKESHIVEVEHSKSEKVVFEAVISDFPTGSWAYRAERRALYPEGWNWSL
ncbi:aryl-sulfate sulfotransferase [Bacillus sp. 1P06AnD]|uniref:aryl-sulfate sulfotransferase n=1 Tax=Bacillus sp. 1P06AnD TaxID=3132208 RepID=UPI0039A2B242